MKPSLIDTDILSIFFRKHPRIIARFANYLTRHKKIELSIITYYEIISGLEHINAHKKTTAFLEFVSMNRVLPLTEQSVTISAGIYAELRKTGKPLDDIDLLIAGVAIANNRVLVTHNRSHFERTDRLEVEDWSEEQTAGR
uniref:tRNA(fMet)-specific endonuclease VapC n=1 Tax=Candidatus Kentrum sp. LPFa TaxID=2126335 RepID=A0A450VTK3_9GAMM|nr:MAG: tRNA(fMet)-specific endonuclease VapC [Candidatus Kentron sp. LPFa]VFK23223.1 MAG: tRNA(fMet)-specific endonuclease VapC [Candidatus Kentron sp. LPFa]